MAARYVDTANIVAQGQSFYTGLLPGSYEKGGAGGGGSNVMGKGSGGSAGVSADRTASDAAGQSIKEYRAGGSILPGDGESDTDRIVKAIEDQGKGGVPTPDPTQKGDGEGGVAPTDTSGEDFSGLAGLGLYAGGGPRADVFSEGGVRPRNAEEEAKHQEGLAKGKATRDENKRLVGVGKEAEGDKQGSGLGAWMKSSDAVDALKQTEASRPTGGGTAPPLPDPGDVIKKGTMGQWDRFFSGSVQHTASSRAHTRQSGVQQSASHKSFLYPNMANSTNRALNF